MGIGKAPVAKPRLIPILLFLFSATGPIDAQLFDIPPNHREANILSLARLRIDVIKID